MDNQLLFILIGSTILFVAVLVWKLRWFYKKMIESEQQQSSRN